MDPAKIEQVIDLLASQSTSQLESFFLAEGLGEAFARPGKNWGRRKRVNEALLEAQRLGTLDKLVPRAQLKFGPTRTLNFEIPESGESYLNRWSIDGEFLPKVTRVVVKNYKSIAACDVSPVSLTFLVGPNGSGKSNFLDALRFLSDSLKTSLDHALRDRGGIQEVRRRSGGHPTHFGMRIEFQLPSGSGWYAFRIGAKPQGGFEVQQEECEVWDSRLQQLQIFKVKGGRVSANIGTVPPAQKDRLYLVNAAGLLEFRPLYDFLSSMGFYNLNPERLRELQPPDPGQLLTRDGSNVSSVLARISRMAPEVEKRIESYLSRVVPGVTGVDAKAIGPMETLEFRQIVRGASAPWRFPAASMSDGTLRALGILVALFQGRGEGGREVPLVGIEEPELALHPAAAGTMFDALVEAATESQVVVTSHSPDLLDDERLSTDSILAVVSVEGTTRIGPLDPAGLSALRDHLYTAGELLRLNQLAPDPNIFESLRFKQPSLF